MSVSPNESDKSSRGLVPALGLFHATMLVIGGIVGSGIFINPHVVARQLHTSPLILGVWILGGLVALAGAFIYAELAVRLPCTGGQYAYLREAYHPAVAFSYGWALLLVIQTGGMAAVAVTFAKYLHDFAPVPFADGVVATSVLLLLTFVNCCGVRAGGAVQSALTVAKIVIIAAVVLCGWLVARPIPPASPPPEASTSLFAAVGSAMIPVIFAYGGWQTSNFVAGEIKNPARNLPRALFFGVLGVIALYLTVNLVYLRVLGPSGLAADATPASAVMRSAFSDRGAQFIAAGIAISALGFLGQSILTAPRVYFAMAEDGLFFRSLTWLHPRTHVPVVAIVVQGICATVIALSGTYEQILRYVVSMDSLFFGLSATSLFVFRRRASNGATDDRAGPLQRVPGHPFTTLFFVIVCWVVFIYTIYPFRIDGVIGVAIALAGLPLYFLWQRRKA